MYYLIRGNSVGYSCGITRIPGIPLPGPVPILVGLIILREAGLVLARYPFGSVTTVLQLHTFHLFIATPRPELVVRTPHSAWGSPGFREFSRGLEALAQIKSLVVSGEVRVAVLGTVTLCLDPLSRFWKRALVVGCRRLSVGSRLAVFFRCGYSLSFG